jgi:molybdate transport system substrate-binding protein
VILPDHAVRPPRWPVAILALWVAGCGAGSAATTSGTRSVELTIFAAASLKDVLAEVSTAYEATVAGTDITIATDSSAALAAQIEQGAPADVFLSADTVNPQKLVDRGLVGGSIVPFATNALTIVVPLDDPAGIATPADLARAGVKVIAAADDVPVSRYVAHVIDDLAGQPGYPADFADRYLANVVSREENVKAIVAKLELGEADAGIVYVTDARASTRVREVPIPVEANVVATYGGVVVKTTDHPAAAAAFLDWLTRSEGQAILADFAFLPPTS